MKGSRHAPCLPALILLVACDLGTTYEGAGPAYYETYTRDPALRVQREVASLATTPISSMPTMDVVDFTGGFVGQIGGCGFDPGCDHSNRVYGDSWVRADFATGGVSASISSLIIEYSETDEFGYNTVSSIRDSIVTRTAGVISGNTFSGVEMTTYNYIGNNGFIVVNGELDGSFKGEGASAVTGVFSGSIASVTGGYPLDGYETLTGQVSAQREP